MRSAQRLKDMGIPSWFHAHARNYERLFGNLGWNDNQIDHALRFGAKFEGDEKQLVQQFTELAARIDAPDVDLSIDVGLGLRDMIEMGGVESLPPLPAEPFTNADEARLQEIRAISRNDPHAFDSNQALQDEQLRLLELREGSNVAPVRAPERVEAAPKQQRSRLEEIREYRRNNPTDWENNRAIQTEEMSLLEASVAPAPAPTASGNIE